MHVGDYKNMQLDTSHELIITPHLRGVKLHYPNGDASACTNRYSVKEVLDFPCNAFFLSVDSVILNINQFNAYACGFDSTQQAIGKTAIDCLSKKDAAKVTASDKAVLSSNHVVIVNDVVTSADEELMNFLTIKAPVYNKDSRIAGIFGFSINLSTQPLAESITLIQNLGILTGASNVIQSSYKIDMSIFTKRQMDIIYYLIRGRTAAEIAAQLKLSRRTVENYIAGIKDMLNVKTRSELINILVD